MSSDIAGRFGLIDTQYQVKPHEGFASGAVHPSYKFRGEDSEAPATPLLAMPPEWTNDGYMPCVPPSWFSLADKVEHMSKWDDVPLASGPHSTRFQDGYAKELCEGCPVLAQCRADAMEQEVSQVNVPRLGVKIGDPLNHSARYTIRGGWTPRKREKVAVVLDKSYVPETEEQVA